MGILRTDRVSGLGGANAIKGSVEFRADQNIQAEIVNDNADFNYGSGDFTIECWWNSGGDLSTDINFVTLWNYSSSRQAWGMYWDADDGNFGLIATSTGSMGSGDLTYRQAAGFEKNRWYHLAIVRISNTLTLYKDGTSIGSNSSFTGTIYENTVDPLIIGGQMNGTDESSKIMRGFISNLRIIKGEGIYTGNFTPPTSELTVTPNTVLLACQSPGDILHEATGKKLIAYRRTLNSSLPVASRFTPNSPVGFSTTTDVGTQFGSTFDGVTTFDSQAYFVPPGGNTRVRNRGRGLILGGATGSPSTNTDIIKYFDVASQGITETFGNLTDPDGNGRRSLASVSSSTRACTGGGYSHGGSPGTVKNIIDFVTIANTGNATDFGDMQNTAYAYAPASNQTRGLFAGGYQPNNSTVVNTIDLITIATTGNASNFGDLTVIRRALAGLESTTRGVFAGGTFPAVHDEIDFVTFSTTGNATDFGDLTDERDNVRASSSSTRGVMAGGRDPSNTNIIDFITIASAGNATDFGDLLSAKFYYAATGNKTRAVWAGDNSGTNAMEFVTIATTGNGVDFGDQNGTPQHYNGCASDSHGGLE